MKEGFAICSGEYAPNKRWDRQHAAVSSETANLYIREGTYCFAESRESDEDQVSQLGSLSFFNLRCAECSIEAAFYFISVFSPHFQLLLRV